MSDSENVFARWSRLKREREEKPAERAINKDNPADLGQKTEERAVPAETASANGGADLPSVDSITTGSQVGAFLKSGVPAELAQSALRRAWSSEPAIRDFIGLSENAWDFNAPAGVPGFGALKAEEVVELLTQVFGEPSESSALSAGEPQAADGSSALVNLSEPETEVPKPATGDAEQIPDLGDQNAHNQLHESVSLDPGELKPVSRLHGGALPK